MTDPAMTEENLRETKDTVAVFLRAGHAHRAGDSDHAADVLCDFVSDPVTGPPRMAGLAAVGAVIAAEAVRKRLGPTDVDPARGSWLIGTLPGGKDATGDPAQMAAIQAVTEWLNDPDSDEFPSIWAHFAVAGHDGLMDIVGHLVMIYAAVTG